MHDLLIAPFAEFEFHAARACRPVRAGTWRGSDRRLFDAAPDELTGDAMAHAILPGAAVVYLVSGLSLGAMTLGGLVAGFLVAILAGAIARSTEIMEDASMAPSI